MIDYSPFPPLSLFQALRFPFVRPALGIVQCLAFLLMSMTLANRAKNRDFKYGCDFFGIWRSGENTGGKGEREKPTYP